MHTWAVSVPELSDSELSRLSSVCSRAELERSARFVFERDRRSYLAAHGLLRHALSDCEPECAPSQWSFETRQYGRPELAGHLRSPLRFNLTHCSTRVAVVVCRNVACGIDVEPVLREADSALLISKSLSEQEQAWVTAAGPELRTDRFLQLWTLKEAISKAVGLGLRLPFAELDLDVSGPPVLRGAPPEAAGPWWLAQRRSADGHIEALALQLPPGQPVALSHHAWSPG
nr:4'-phosphopantetheinyl transferase [uncultured bacterium]